MSELTISGVAPGSIADELGIRAGDALLRINGQPVRDLIDYEFLAADAHLVLLLRGADGEEYEAEIEKEADEEIGLALERDGLGRKLVCRNKCLFCFVDQLPKGMRGPLYVKDDDWRLSFLMGNYITLTNLGEDEIARIIDQKLSPLYVSVHASDDEVRVRLLGCEAAKDSFRLLARLAQNGITLHTQVVLCPGVNDGAVLERTIDDLYALHPGVASVAVVPVGLTGHRDGCSPLSPVDQINAEKALWLIEQKQNLFLKQSGTRFVFAADELYIRAGMALPPYESYEDFCQIENGVGLVAKFFREADEALRHYRGYGAIKKSFGIVTGVDAAPYLRDIAQKITRTTGQEIAVYPVENDFLGRSVTVAGLLTGGDVVKQLKGKITADILMFSAVSFREQDDVMLDDVTLEELEQTLGCACKIVPSDGYMFAAQFFEGE